MCSGPITLFPCRHLWITLRISTDVVQINMWSFHCSKTIINFKWKHLLSVHTKLKKLCLPPSVTEEVYCFPRCKLIFSFYRRVIYHLRCLREYIQKSMPSVCLYHDLQTNSGTFFLSQKFDVIHQWIRLNELYKLMESFFKFKICFRINGQKPKNIQTDSDAWIFIKEQCVIYQWIHFDKLYKLIVSFFQILFLFSNYWPKTKNIRNEVRFVQARWGRHLCWSARFLEYSWFCSVYSLNAYRLQIIYI